MSTEISKDNSATQQVRLQIEHLKRTVKSPHDLVEHVIQLYAAEFDKANNAIADLRIAAKADADMLEEMRRALEQQKRANDELFRIKQRVVIANRELVQTNSELVYLLQRVLADLPAKRDWLDPQLERIMRTAAQELQHVLPAITDALREAHARVQNELAIADDHDAGFARDLAALCEFIELYDKATAKDVVEDTPA